MVRTPTVGPARKVSNEPFGHMAQCSTPDRRKQRREL
jgi:hypothetical protein